MRRREEEKNPHAYWTDYGSLITERNRLQIKETTAGLEQPEKERLGEIVAMISSIDAERLLAKKRDESSS